MSSSTMSSKFRTLGSSLIIILAAQAAFALTPVTRPADPRPIDQLVPAGTPTTAFASVKRAFELYGSVITASPRYQQLLPLIAQGLPDPARDIDEVGVCTDLTDRENMDVGFVFTGRVDRARVLAFAAAHHVTFTTSMYRGIELLSGKTDSRAVQIAFFDERITVVSADWKGLHPITHPILDNLLTQAQPHDTILTPGYLINVAQSVREWGANASGSWGFLAHIAQLKLDAQPNADTKNVAIKIIILTDSHDFATQFSQQLVQYAAAAHTHIADPVVTVVNSDIHFDCTLLKSAIEGYLGNN